MCTIPVFYTCFYGHKPIIATNQQIEAAKALVKRKFPDEAKNLHLKYSYSSSPYLILESTLANFTVNYLILTINSIDYIFKSSAQNISLKFEEAQRKAAAFLAEHYPEIDYSRFKKSIESNGAIFSLKFHEIDKKTGLKLWSSIWVDVSRRSGKILNAYVYIAPPPKNLTMVRIDRHTAGKWPKPQSEINTGGLS